MEYKRKIKNLSTKTAFVVEVMYEPTTAEKLDFEFSNNRYLLEKNILKIIDNNGNILHPETIISIKPIESKSLKVIISNEKPFIYTISGTLIPEGEFVRLKLPSVEYLLTKGKKYNIELKDQHNLSNRLVFNM